MKTIWKFPIVITDTQTLSVPRDSKFIHAGLDPKCDVCVWAEVETSNPPRETAIVIVGTGHPLPASTFKHFASFVIGPFVWHVYAYDFTQ